ncbi:MAG: hypothetical protein NVS2B14_17540 [Chamaesiphon sp.]
MLANRQVQIITYEPKFGEIFLFNQQIVKEVINLVRQIYNGGVVELPIEVGDFGTPDEALSLQKSFNPPKTIDNVPSVT